MSGSNVRKTLTFITRQAPYGQGGAKATLDMVLSAAVFDQPVIRTWTGMTPLTPDDVAETIVWVADRPAHVQVAEVILKTTQWTASLDVRLGLIHNPKTPQAFALRILPTLPDAEVRAALPADDDTEPDDDDED